MHSSLTLVSSRLTLVTINVHMDEYLPIINSLSATISGFQQCENQRAWSLQRITYEARCKTEKRCMHQGKYKPHQVPLISKHVTLRWKIMKKCFSQQIEKHVKFNRQKSFSSSRIFSKFLRFFKTWKHHTS